MCYIENSVPPNTFTCCIHFNSRNADTDISRYKYMYKYFKQKTLSLYMIGVFFLYIEYILYTGIVTTHKL